MYHVIEDKCRDNDGYFEAFSREFNPVSNDKLSENGVIAERTMNSLLHIMEAYTELYRADHFYEVGDSIREILRIFKFKVYNPDKEMCEVFFDKTYHSLINLESYGHDIETSWLIGRACEVLEDKVVDHKKVWWVQAESVTGFYNAYKNEPSRMDFLEISEQIWDYINKYVIDKQSGEWIENISSDNTAAPAQALAHPWKCPYHNGRMCIEMINRLSMPA